MTHVLQISPFPIPADPRSGGTIRIAETRKAYERAGATVSTSCIVTRQRDLQNPCDLVLPWLHKLWRPHLGQPSHLGPLRIRWSTTHSESLLRQLLATLPSRIDVIHLEHPWAIRLATQAREHPACRAATIVYGAHNIEQDYHRGIWTSAGQWNAKARRLATWIHEAEAEAAQLGDLCWAVSSADADALTALGARQVLVAPNACRTLPSSTDASGVPPYPYAVYAGGGSAANVEGLITWLGTPDSYVPQGTAILIAGSVCDKIRRLPAFRPAFDSGRLRPVGDIDGPQLDRLLLNARCVLLPISRSGGTNLKTAEALSSQRAVVATPLSLRGYEVWQDAPGVHLGTTPAEFQQHVRSLLARHEMPDARRTGIEILGWQHALEPAVSATLNLARA